MGFGLKNKQVNFSGLQNIAVHVTVNLATLCINYIILLQRLIFWKGGSIYILKPTLKKCIVII